MSHWAMHSGNHAQIFLAVCSNTVILHSNETLVCVINRCHRNVKDLFSFSVSSCFAAA